MKEKIAIILYNKFSIYIIPTLILLSFCYTNNIMIINRIVTSGALFFSILTIILYIFNGKFSNFLKWFTAYFLLILLSSFLGKYSSPYLMIQMYLRILALTMYLDIGFNNIPNKMIKVLNRILYILVVINFYTIIAYPNGLYSTERYTRNWFFMYENTHIFMYLPALITSYIYGMKNNKKIQFYILLAIIIYCVALCQVSTSIVALVLFVLYIIFHKRIDKFEFMNPKNYFKIFILIFVFIVLLRLQNIFEWLIVDILGKKLTFTDRTYIWDAVISLIKEKPILGYGIEPTAVYSQKLGKIFYTSAHNTILDILYKGGLLALFCFIKMIMCSTVNLSKEKNNKIVKTIAISLLCCFIMMNFEARQEKIGLYIILIICFYCKKIINEKRSDEIESN